MDKKNSSEEYTKGDEANEAKQIHEKESLKEPLLDRIDRHSNLIVGIATILLVIVTSIYIGPTE